MASANTVEIIFKATDQASAGINAIAQRFDDMGRKIGAAGRNITGSTAGITSVTRAAEQLGSSSTVAAAGVTKIGASLSSAAQKAEEFGRKARLPAEALAGTVAAASGATQGIQNFGTAAGAATGKVRMLGDAAAKIGAQAAGASAGFQTLAVAAQAPAQALAGTAQAAANAARGVTQVGAAAGGAAAGLQTLAGGALSLGPALDRVTRANATFVAGMGKFGDVRPQFQAVQGMIEGLGASFVKTGQIGADQITKLKVQLAELARAKLITPTSGAEAGIYANAQRQLQEATRIQRQFNAAHAETAAAVRASSGAVQASGGALTAFRGVLSSVIPALTAVGAAMLVFSQLKDTFKQFLAAEAGMRALSASLQTIGGDLEAMTARAEEAVTSLVKVSTFDDDEIRGALTTLITITGNLDAALLSMGGAIDLAAARGIDLEQASTMIGRAIEGNVTALTRFGIKLSEADAKLFEFMTEAERAAIVMERFQETMGGRGQAQIDAYAGKVKLIANAWGNAKEDAGKFFVAVGAWIVQDFQKLDEYTKRIGNFFRAWRSNVFGTGEKPFEIPFRKPAEIVSGGRSSVNLTAQTDAARKNAVAREAEAKALKTLEKAQKDAAAEAQRYAQELDALTVSAKATAGEQRLLTAAVARFGDVAKAANVDQIRTRIVALGDSMVQAGRKMSTAFRGFYLSMKAVEENLKVDWDEVFQADEFERARQKILGGEFGIPMKIIIEPKVKVGALEKIGRDFTRGMQQAFSNVFSDVLTDFAVTGGKNFKDIIARAIEDGARVGAKALQDMLSTALGKAFGKKQIEALPGGGYRVGDQTFTGPGAYGQAQQAAGGNMVDMLSQGLSGALGLYSAISAKADDLVTVLTGVTAGAALGGAVGGLVAGATVGSAYPVIGTIIGAVVGLIVGGIAAALSSVGEDYKYGIPAIRDGRAVFTPGQNIGDQEAAEITRRMQQTLDKFYGGFSRILLKVQDFIPDFVRNMDISFTRGLDQGGYIGRAASANFMKHLERLIVEGIPSEVGRAFRPAFEAAFQSMGYTVERFNELWTMLEGMDPQAGLQMLETLVDVGLGLQRFTNMPGWNTTVGPGFDIQPGILQQEYERMNRTPAAALYEDLGAQIEDYAESLSQLTGEAQITRAQELVGLMDQWQEAARNVAREQLAATEALEKSFGATIRDLELEGMKTPTGQADAQAQVEYLKRYADELMAQLPQATSFAEATQMADEIRAVILRIKALGGTLGDGAEEAYRLWALENLKNVQQIALDRIKELGQQMEEQTNSLREAIQGMIDAFLGATEAITGVPRERPEPPPPPPPELPEGIDGGGGPPPRVVGARHLSFGVPDDVWQPIVTLPFEELALEAGTLRDRFRTMSEELEAQSAVVMDAGGSHGVMTPEFAKQIEAIEDLAVPPIAWDELQAGALAAMEEFSGRTRETMDSLSELGDGLLDRRADLEEFGRSLKDIAATKIEIQADTPEPIAPPDRLPPLTYPEDRAEERQRMAESIEVLEAILAETRARRASEGATANRIASALEDGVRVEGGEYRFIIEQGGERVADFTSRIQQARTGRGRR